MSPQLDRSTRVLVATAAGLAMAFVGFAAGYAPAPAARAQEADVAPAPAQLDASAASAVDGAAAGGPLNHRGRIIIVYPRPYPCYPVYPCPGYPYPNPCYDPNFPPFPGPPVPPPPGSTPAPTVPPGATAAPPTPFPMPSPTPGGMASTLQYRVCPQVKGTIPQHIQDLATTEPWRYYGFGELRNPNVPYHPLWNGYRTWLSLRDTNQPYSPCNLPLWKSGCP